MTLTSISLAMVILLGSFLPAGESLQATSAPYSQDQHVSDANPGERVRLAVGALMLHYDESTGLWDNKGWWNGANALTTLLNGYKGQPFRSGPRCISQHLRKGATTVSRLS